MGVFTASARAPGIASLFEKLETAEEFPPRLFRVVVQRAEGEEFAVGAATGEVRADRATAHGLWQPAEKFDDCLSAGQ